MSINSEASSSSPSLPPLNAQTLQKAAEISLNRWYRAIVSLKQVQLTRTMALKRLEDITTRLAVGLGLAARDVNYPQESSLLGPSLSPMAYSLTVCWGQLYVLIWIFSTWLIGSLFIFLCFKLLGSSHSYMEVTSTLGYAMAPLALLEPLMTMLEEPLPGLGIILKLLAVIWASRTATLALIQPFTEKKTFLFACPVVLFNVYLLSFRSGA